MELSQLTSKIARIESEVAQALRSVREADELRRLENSVLDRTGSLGVLITAVKQYPAQQRPEAGRTVNEAKSRVKALLDAKHKELAAGQLAADRAQTAGFDPTLPGTVEPVGSVHPVTAVQWEVERLFERLGFTVEAGPEMESEYMNFEALNIPATHPARDMQDTFWLDNGRVLRTQTSPVQVRAMLKFGARCGSSRRDAAFAMKRSMRRMRTRFTRWRGC